MNKIHSIHALPSGREFSGKIEAGGAKYQFSFTPRKAAIVEGKLVLAGSATVKSAQGVIIHQANKVEAKLLATQGSAEPAPPVPASLADRVDRPALKPPFTEATGELSSVGVIYFKLSGLKAAGLPFDLSGTQLNARLFPRSQVERELHWLYSALVRATLGEKAEEEKATVYLGEINRILK